MIFDKRWREERTAKRKVQELNDVYEPKIQKAERTDNDQYQGLLAEFFHERDVIEDPVKRARTRIWMAKGAEQGIKIPTTDERGLWERSVLTGEFNLTDEGVAEIRRRITTDKEERLRYRTVWLRDIVAPVTALLSTTLGILSTILGLLVMLRSCK
jgi:hypothetical protein